MKRRFCVVAGRLVRHAENLAGAIAAEDSPGIGETHAPFVAIPIVGPRGP